jgi:hypothetical protein
VSGNNLPYESRNRSRKSRKLREGLDTPALRAVNRIAPGMNVEDAYLFGSYGYIIRVNGKYNYLDIASGELESDQWFNTPQEVEDLVRRNDPHNAM